MYHIHLQQTWEWECDAYRHTICWKQNSSKIWFITWTSVLRVRKTHHKDSKHLSTPISNLRFHKIQNPINRPKCKKMKTSKSFPKMVCSFMLTFSRIHSTSKDMGYPTARRCTLRALHWWVCWYTRAWRTMKVKVRAILGCPRNSING